MESYFNELQTALKGMEESFSTRKNLQGKYKKLINYYESKQRQKDCDDVNNGKLIPKGPHGILSEDAIYDFANEQRDILCEMQHKLNNVLK